MEDFNIFNIFQELEEDYLETETDSKLVYLSKRTNNFSDPLNIVQTIYKK